MTQQTSWWAALGLVVLWAAWSSSVGAQILCDGELTVGHTPIYNVKDYGATGDGTTDDTAFIAAAFTAAGNNSIVYFPAGTYSTLLISLSEISGVTIRGQGHTSVVKRRADGVNTNPVFLIQDSFNVTVEHLGVDINNCLQFCSGIGINHTTNFRIQFNHIFDSNLNTANSDDKFGILVQGGGDDNRIDTPSYILYNIVEDAQVEVDRVSNLLIQGNKVIRPRSTAGIGSFSNSIGITSYSRNVMIVDNVIQDAHVTGGAITVHIDPPEQTNFTFADYVIARNVILYHTDSAAEQRSGIKIGSGNLDQATTGNIFRNFQIKDNYIWAHPTVYVPSTLLGIFLASSATTNFVFDRFVVEGNSVVLPNIAAVGFYILMMEKGVIRGNSFYNVVHSGSTGISFELVENLRLYDNDIHGTAGKGIRFNATGADLDVRSWGNTITGGTLPWHIDGSVTAEYWLQDFTYGGVVQVVSAVGNTIQTWTPLVKIQVTTPVTLTSTPSLAAGRDTQRVSIVNTSANTVTLQDERSVTGTKLYVRGAAATLALGPFEMRSFVYVGELAAWVQE